MTYVLGLPECTPDRAALVGGKAAGLARLIEQGLPVPGGYAITTRAYAEFVAACGLQVHIDALLEEAGSPEADRRISQEIGRLFEAADLPPAMASEIRDAYREIGDSEPVAVRSSAVAEDKEDASFAGQQETYLWVMGPDEVVRNVRRCWASLFTPQAIAYRSRMNVPADQVVMCVVVQRMVPAAAAGVMMTLEPVTGDRSQLYIETAHGLGEGVVRGDVETDRYWIEKATLDVIKHDESEQARGYLFDTESGAVRLMDLPDGLGTTPSIGLETVQALAQLGLAVEERHGRPMDIEWAVSAEGDVFLVQARPETVWSNREAPLEPGGGHDVLHATSRPQTWWTTTNAGEAIPGVPTPLGWSVWGMAAEGALRKAFQGLGVLSEAETARPAASEDRLFGIFYGRPAFQIDLLSAWGDRIPGTSGSAIAEQICGFVPPDLVSRPARRHYPRAALKMPSAVVMSPKYARRQRAEINAFWQASINGIDGLDETGARVLLFTAVDRFVESARWQCFVVFGAVQPAYDILVRVAAAAGVDAQTVMGGLGDHEEGKVVRDMWACSRGRLGLDAFLGAHGFHGPHEGEISSRSWREDPEPVKRLIDRYRAAPDTADPVAADTARAEQRRAVEAHLIASTPRNRRWLAHLALRFAARNLPLRGVAKVALIQSNDVARCAARRLGSHLAECGFIDAPEDVFYLTLDELRAGAPVDARERVKDRQARRAAYQQTDIPSTWQGTPEPVSVKVDPDSVVIEGIAASPGVIEGAVRVVTDPADATIETGEILVARDTDQGWASLMFLSGGLVADIGGVMSHTAVVARELGIPCVVSTRIGTKRLTSGDRVRVDGSTGTIEILTEPREPAWM